MSERYYFILLRHGESVGNASGRWQGQQDFPLNDHGRLQAHGLAERWAQEGRQFDRMAASPLSRARETAEIIAERLGLTIDIDPVWMERDNGVLAGSLREAAPSGGPRHVFEPIGEHGESLNDLFLRAGRALNSVIRKGPGRQLIVAHGGILNQVICYALGLPPQPGTAGVRFDFGNTGFATLEFDPGRNRWYVRGINDMRHIESHEPQDVWQG